MRLELEEAIRRGVGEVTFEDIALVQTVCRVETLLRTLEKRIKAAGDTLSPKQTAKLRGQVLQASQSRDAVISRPLPAGAVLGEYIPRSE